MDAVWSQFEKGGPQGPRWSLMVVLSVVVHLAFFSTVFLIPKPLSTRAFKGVVYEVNLVELPRKGPPVRSTGPSRAVPDQAKKAQVTGAQRAAKRISTPGVKERPVVLAKRTVTRGPESVKKPEVPTSKLIEEAISKIESKVKAEKQDPLKRALAGIEERVKEMDAVGAAGKEGGQGDDASDGGLALRMYELQIYDAIKRNWSYPVDLSSSEDHTGLEAVVVMRVSRSGRILKVSLEKRSANGLFDQSVLKAIERSNPLPPFPDFYREPEDEIQVTFTLSDLEEE